MSNCCFGKFRLFNLEEQFAFYGAYHRNPVNVAIHIVFVWPIFLSALLLLYFTPLLFGIPPVEFSLFGRDVVLLFNAGFLVALVYAVFYLLLDVKAGSLAFLLCGFCWVVSNFLGCLLGFSLAWKVAVVTQVVCWTGQFIGHGHFEKRAPALLDNLVQAFLMAPFFVLLEALQAIGYEPYPGFRTKVDAMIEAEVCEWKEKNQSLVC